VGISRTNGEQLGETDNVKDIERCRWQWRNYMQRTEHTRVPRGRFVIGREIEEKLEDQRTDGSNGSKL
jgi:hypothetical protein